MSVRAGLLTLLLIAGIWLAAPATAGADPAPVLKDLRLGLHKDFTRVVLETDRPTAYRVAAKGQTIFVVRLNNLKVAGGAEPPVGKGLVRRLLVKSNGGMTGIALQLEDRARLRRHFALPPRDGKGPRIVIDFTTAPVLARDTAAPLVELPAPHHDLRPPKAIGRPDAAGKPLTMRQPAQARPVPAPATQRKPTSQRPLGIVSAGDMVMHYEGDDFDPIGAMGADDPATEFLQLAQATPSVGDWLRSERGNPNVAPGPYGPAPQPVYQPPSPAFPGNAPSPQYAPPAPAYTPPPSYAPRIQRRDYRGPIYDEYQRQLREAEATKAAQDATESTLFSDDGDDAADSAVSAPLVDDSPAQPSTFAGFSDDFGGWDQGSDVYLGAGVGATFFDFDTDSRGSRDVESSAIGWKMMAGYRPTTRIALEASFGSLGKVTEIFSNQRREDEYRAIALNAVLFLGPDNRLRPFIKGGVHYWMVNRSTGRAVDSLKDSGFGGQAGAGVDYALTQSIALRGEWEFHAIDDNIFANALTAMALYNF